MTRKVCFPCPSNRVGYKPKLSLLGTGCAEISTQPAQPFRVTSLTHPIRGSSGAAKDSGLPFLQLCSIPGFAPSISTSWKCDWILLLALCQRLRRPRTVRSASRRRGPALTAPVHCQLASFAHCCLPVAVSSLFPSIANYCLREEVKYKSPLESPSVT